MGQGPPGERPSLSPFRATPPGDRVVAQGHAASRRHALGDGEAQLLLLLSLRYSSACVIQTRARQRGSPLFLKNPNRSCPSGARYSSFVPEGRQCYPTISSKASIAAHRLSLGIKGVIRVTTDACGHRGHCRSSANISTKQCVHIHVTT